jgi:hypothetical protein
MRSEEEDALLNIHRTLDDWDGAICVRALGGGREPLLRKQELEIQHHNHAYRRLQRQQAQNHETQTFGTPNSLGQLTGNVDTAPLDVVLAHHLLYQVGSKYRAIPLFSILLIIVA